MGSNIKYTYEHVKNYVENAGYKLLSTEYKNAFGKLKVQCPKGHIYEVKYNDFQQGHRCGICANNIKYTYEYIKTYIENTGYRLLSTKYVNTNTALDVICPNKHKWTVSFKRFKNGVRCKYCYGNNKKTQSEVKKIIEKEGYKLLSEYKGVAKKIKVQCPNGHVYKTTYGRFNISKTRCPVCNGGIRLAYDYVKGVIEKEGYKLLSTKYKNAFSKLKLQCPLGHIYNVHYGSFKNSRNRCPICNALNKSSKAETEISEFIQEKYPNIKMINNDRSFIINPKTKRYLELDILMPNLNKAIEFNGVYWHSKAHQKYKDIVKKKQCIEKGIDLLVIEEENWIENKEQCLNNIEDFLKVIIC